MTMTVSNGLARGNDLLRLACNGWQWSEMDWPEPALLPRAPQSGQHGFVRAKKSGRRGGGTWSPRRASLLTAHVSRWQFWRSSWGGRSGWGLDEVSAR